MTSLMNKVEESYKINNVKAEQLLSKSIIDEYMTWYKQFQINQRWVKARSILYQLCEEHPEHSNDDWIVAKIWLIGRSYAAAVERVQEKDFLMADDYYYDKVAQGLHGKFGKELDTHIFSLKSSNNTEDRIFEMLETHQLLTSKLKSITGLDKRSLASKYLHFHIPSCFYIYDSRANKTIKIFVRKENHNAIPQSDLYDNHYSDFVYRMLLLQKHLCESLPQGLESITPRFLDSFLLYIHKKYLK